MNISITVHGTPKPQGSTRAFIPKGWSRPVITAANKDTKPWRQDVSSQALAAMQGQTVSLGPVGVKCIFFFLKPKSAKKSVTEKITKPDVDKLLRAILDGLTGVCFRDDSQVVRVEAEKVFSDSYERAEIAVCDYVREMKPVVRVPYKEEDYVPLFDSE